MGTIPLGSDFTERNSNRNTTMDYNEEYYPDEDLKEENYAPTKAQMENKLAKKELKPIPAKSEKEIERMRAERYAQGPFFW
jgi:hypothetical protein